MVGKSAGLGRPLRVPTFRNLLIADLVSDIGTFMQSVGAAWLMVSLHAGPGYVALIQTAASLPYFLLALPAGAAGDIFDRRRLVLFTEVWMMGVALILAVLTIVGLTSPWLTARQVGVSNAFSSRESECQCEQHWKARAACSAKPGQHAGTTWSARW
jgi:MFS family permease